MSLRRSMLSCAAWLIAVLSGRGSDAGDALARLASETLCLHETHIAKLQTELRHLPAAPADQTTERAGWHSRLGPSGKTSPKSITVDLGSEEDFDAVVLIPVNAPSGANAGPGYGFPVRFRVEALDDDSSILPVTLADFTHGDFAEPGDLPVVLETPTARGRFVRVTATRLFARDGFSLFALGEVMILRGHQNIAAGANVRVSDNYANAPAWQPENATDSQSVLGPPIQIETSPGWGYHSTIAKSVGATKWVQLDLGKAQPIDEVRLYAARPKDFPPRRGFGFPVRFRVEADNDPSFTTPTALANYSDRDFSNPGENPVVIPARQTSARYVRITATRLWERDKDFIFALSEMEVFVSGVNIAAGATISAQDNLETGGWSAARLNDGFTSQGRLVNLADWLRGLSRRREVLQAIASAETARLPLVNQAWQRIAAAIVTTLTIAALAGGVLIARRRRRHRLELARLRQRIAADLHDEIGSNLGSIALLARLAADEPHAETSDDLAEIRRIAQESADSMRDIVWLIQPGPRDPSDLGARMREVAARLLADAEWTFEAEHVPGPFPLEFERQVFLLYKEALNNIRKHASARRVSIRVAQTNGAFRLAIEDDGRGFDPGTKSTGHGLTTMKHRAELIGAKLVLNSSPGSGTQLELHAPLS